MQARLLMASTDPARDFRSADAHHRAGNLDKAEALYNRVLKKVPDQPDALKSPRVIRMCRVLASGSQEAALSRARQHLDHLQTFGAARVTDKMPDNIFLLDRVAAVYPQARVVFCRRDRRDTALSCYFTLFASGNLFSYDLPDCAHRIRETERLADHWRKTLPLRTLTVDYETLVADLEGQSRRLVAFLGLVWDPACLRFYETQRAVSTASSWQVRQPLYIRSVGRWRNYADYLDELVFE